MDMKTMVSAVGAFETLKIASATIQLARFYHLPSRAGGGLTDAHIADAQSLAEGALMLSTVVRNGANCIYHACGQMGSYISMSFEKWLIDEEVCQMVRQMIQPMQISKQTLDLEMIHQIGIGGQYLTHPKTFEQFRSLSQPRLFNRRDFSRWQASGRKRVDEVASEALVRRLEAYESPGMDQGEKEALAAYVCQQKKQRVSFRQ
jgi:trimethylamine--corrinoid protein Co-methyltransferase